MKGEFPFVSFFIRHEEPAQHKDLIAYWKLDEKIGVTLFDTSYYGEPLTLTEADFLWTYILELIQTPILCDNPFELYFNNTCIFDNFLLMYKYERFGVLQTVSCQPDCTCVDPDDEACIGNLNGMILNDATELTFLVDEDADENTFEWEIYPEVEMTITDSVYAIIAPDLLEEGTNYRLICKKTPNALTTGQKYTRSIDFYVSQNPTAGQIDCMPTSLEGIGYETTFWLSLTGFTDPEDTVFLYSYSYERVGDEIEIELVELSDSPLLRTQLPHGNSDYNHQIKLIGRVYNLYGAIAEETLLLTVEPQDIVDQTTFVQDQLIQARDQGTEAVLQVIHL